MVSSREPPLTLREAAAALNVSYRWLLDYLKTIEPCWLQAGHRKLFDEAAMTVIREAMRQTAREGRPNSPRRISPCSSAFVGRNKSSIVAEALALVRKGRRNRARS